MALAISYRPPCFEDVIGNETTIASLEAVLKRPKEDLHHAYMFTGPSGCGKTTFGRIVADKLGCKGQDFYELDAADFRGIDTIRDMRQKMRYSPTEGDSRVFLLDECFPSFTQIKTPFGDKRIDSLQRGDEIYSITGKTRIEKVHTNRVHLGRVVKLKFSDGTEVITTKQHLFLTSKGWVEAQNLNKKDCILSFLSYTMADTGQQKEVQNAMPNVWSGNTGGSQILLQELRQQVEKERKNSKLYLPLLRERFLGATGKQSKILLQKLFGKRQNATSRNSCCVVQQRNQRQNSRGEQKVSSNRTCQSVEKTKFFAYEKTQPNGRCKDYSKNDGNQTAQRHFEYLERGARGQWEIDRASGALISRPQLAYGSCDIFGRTNRRFSNLLQSGCRKFGIEIGNRGGWDQPHIEKSYADRCQKDKKAGIVRLESVEIYQRGYNDQSFSSVIGNKENDQGFVIFYDLQVAGHPSYFANGKAVHNCHALTKDAQNALLKALEDAPAHVFFILCTTDPQKLLPTIRGRCLQFQVNPLTERQMKILLNEIVYAENKEVSEEVIDLIIRDSLGSPRNALQVLEKIIDLSSREQKKAAEKAASEANVVIDLCRLLMKSPRPKWQDITKIITGLGEADLEQTRLAVMGYCAAVLLKADNPQAYLVMDAFREPWYNNGRSGLVLACYEAFNAD